MKSVLEIPVFATKAKYFEPLISTASSITEKIYRGFTVYNYQLDNQNDIWFYLMDEIPTHGNILHIDQIIPRAPFSLLMVDKEEGFLDTPTGAMYIKHLNKFKTPIFMMVSDLDDSFHTKIASDILLVNTNPSIILYNEEKPNALKRVLLEAIKISTQIHQVK